MIKLEEAFFNGNFSQFIGKENFEAVKKYLSQFQEYNPQDERTLMSFTDDQKALQVTKKIILDAKAEIANGKVGPAFNYIFIRCASSIITHFKTYAAMRRDTIVHLDVTGTGDFSGYVNAAYDFISDDITKMDLSKFYKGDILNNFNYYESLNLSNLDRELLQDEHSNGVNYDGYRSTSVYKYDQDTGKFYDRMTGKEITRAQAMAMQAKANPRYSNRFTSLDDTSTNEDSEYSRADALMDQHSKYTGNNLDSFEDTIVDSLSGTDIMEDWKECCADPRWAAKNNFSASLFKTLLHDMIHNTATEQKQFIDSCGLNKMTFRNYMGLSDGYPKEKTIPGILEDYGIKVHDLVKYIVEHPDEENSILALLPGEKLHEALLRYLFRKALRESRN